MTVTYKLDLDMVKMNYYDKYVRQRLLTSKVIM